MAVASTVTGGRGYGALLRTPHAWTFFLPGFAARQPFAMLTISIVLLLRHTTGSYGQAGTAAAVTGAAMAVCAPRWGRLADRFGQRAVLLPGVPAHAVAVAALTWLALDRAPLWAVLAAAVPVGASVPQIGPMVRARWARALEGSPVLVTAAAFESVTDEFTFVIGPVLATALCTAVHPAAGLLAEAALTLAGGLLFAAARRTAPPAAGRSAWHGGGRRASALAVPGVRALAAAFWGIGAVFGGMQVAVTAFAQTHGMPGGNGLLYGVFAAGNMLSGLACGAWAARGRSTPRGRLLVAYAALVVVSGTLWAAGSPVLLAALGLLTGACVAPTLVNGYALAGDLVAPGARTEAFTWLTGAVALGQAVAATAAGQLADIGGPALAFVVPLAGTAPALPVLLALRSRLAPAAVPERAAGQRSAVAVD